MHPFHKANIKFNIGQQMIDGLYYFMSRDDNLGRTFTVHRLYENLFGKAYDPCDKIERRNRMYIQLMFNEKHSFGQRFYRLGMEGGKAYMLEQCMLTVKTTTRMLSKVLPPIWISYRVKCQ